MNKFLFFAVALLLCSACGSRSDEFVIRGNIPGLKDGMQVYLFNFETEERDMLATDTVRGGRFALHGKVASPTLCQLAISSYGLEGDEQQGTERSAWVFLDNSDLRLEAQHFDSIGYVFDIATSPTERKARVVGGRIQREFDEYRALLHPLEYATDSLKNALNMIRLWRDTMPLAEFQRIEKSMLPQIFARREKAREMQLDFIRRYPLSPVSLYIAENYLKKLGDFKMTVEELDAFAALVKEVDDTVRMPRFRRQMERAMKLAIGAPYTDLELGTTEVKLVRLSDYVHPGRYMLLDFWASWCAPCRDALPRVKEWFRHYDGRLDVVSISCDQSAAAWKKAIQEEQLTEWPQLCVASQKGYADMVEGYNVQAIPRLVLIDDKGKVAFCTNDPNELEMKLQEKLN